jgi:serine/threonine-protein kinase
LAVALLNATTGVLTPVPAMYISWNAVVILLFSMIMWARPVQMLLASLVAASMDPLAVWLASLNGLQVPSFYDAVVLFLPNYACAVIAIVPAQVLHRLGRRLREAQELGSYKLVEPLGHGGMGEVWRAEHRMLARSAAIKLVRPEVLGTAGEAETRLLLKRFEREAKATSALSSPHTIQVFDFGVTNEGRFYYVMELLSGRDIESLVREFGPVSADRAIFLLRQASHSLADAHARGLVHRDIKPANIYVCRMGLEFDFVKVLDFGLVKFNARGAQQQTLVTADHKTTGTPAYMAPEIILGETDVDRRADVYSLGCVAYYLLTGQLVFEAANQMKMLLQHVQAEPVPPSRRTEMPIPREMDDLVMACLEKDPDKRPQNAVELFELACGCRACEAWSNAKAQQWWETHLPELTGPLTLADPGRSSSEPAAVSI